MTVGAIVRCFFKETHMALQRKGPVAAVRRWTAMMLAGDAVVGLLVGTIISHVLGLILFLAGLVVTSGFWYNFRKVLRTRGYH
jgi:hypothetical protein